MNLARAILLKVALTAVAQAQFLVPDQLYRCSSNNTSCRQDHKPPALERGLSGTKHHPYVINYVEYTDKSQLWDKQELKDAVQQVTAAEAGGLQHPLIVVYVNGWQHNASDASGDVKKFRVLMSKLADDYPEGKRGEAPQVVGIYLAWRGLTFTVEPFKHIISYWPRRKVAKEVGTTGIHNAICDIEGAIKGNRLNTFLLLAGHSFGARVLENAIELNDPSGQCPTMYGVFENLKAEALASKNGSQEKLFRLPYLPADLVVYVNAATSSTKTRSRVAQIRNECPEATSAWICQADPLYVAFTSTNDLATGLVMPVANLVFPDLRSDKLHLLSAADTGQLHTHLAPKKGCPGAEAVCFTMADGKSDPAQYYLPRMADRIQVPRLGLDPFWIFNVHSNLVNGHGDVWNPNVVSMLSEILRKNGHYRDVRQKAAELTEREINVHSP